MNRINDLYERMIAFDTGRPELIQHFTKVHSYARLIAQVEGLSDTLIIEAAALVHDIAIPLCENKYGSDAGSLQELEGPALARPMLEAAAFETEAVDRVCFLVSRHHTCQPVEGLDHQILLEADAMVNSFENRLKREDCQQIYAKIFKTKAGRRLYALMFGLEESVDAGE